MAATWRTTRAERGRAAVHHVHSLDLSSFVLLARSVDVAGAGVVSTAEFSEQEEESSSEEDEDGERSEEGRRVWRGA